MIESILLAAIVARILLAAIVARIILAAVVARTILAAVTATARLAGQPTQLSPISAGLSGLASQLNLLQPELGWIGLGSAGLV